jgi:hypothetical protein
MKSKPEYVKGPEAWKRFEGAMKGARCDEEVLAVPHAEIELRIAEHRGQAAKNRISAARN